MDRNELEKLYAGVLGVAAGDAVGVPFEFLSKSEIKRNPATDMTSGGYHNQPKGFWSDDTSMMLAMMDGMSEWKGREDYVKVMDCFCDWLFDAKYTPADHVFDAGITCQDAVYNYRYEGAGPEECGIADEMSNGNGALMRILPALFYVRSKYGEHWIDNKDAVTVIEKLTALTHAHKRSRMASVMYLSVCEKILEGKDKESAVKEGLRAAREIYSKNSDDIAELKYFDRVAGEDFKETSADDLPSSGYVIDTIEAAIWAFLTTDNYRECILKVINLGKDTDTAAAVAGGLAGLYYGLKGIPEDWLRSLARFGYLKEMCDKYADAIESERR